MKNLDESMGEMKNWDWVKKRRIEQALTKNLPISPSPRLLLLAFCNLEQKMGRKGEWEKGGKGLKQKRGQKT